MSTVKEILEIKGEPKEVWYVTSLTSTYDALKLMADKDIGALLVMDEGKVAGIISERDVVRRISEDGFCQLTAPVSDMMTQAVICVGLAHSVQNCMGLMIENHIRHLPVVQEGQVVGLISVGDVVKSLIGDREEQIHGLENYILGTEHQQ